MRTFKDWVKSDREIFFNLDEFGEVHIIDGDATTCIFESDVYEDMDERSSRYGGVYNKLLTLFVKAEDLVQRPQISEYMEIDGERYEVVNVDDTSKLYEISLQRYDY